MSQGIRNLPRLGIYPQLSRLRESRSIYTFPNVPCPCRVQHQAEASQVRARLQAQRRNFHAGVTGDCSWETWERQNLHLGRSYSSLPGTSVLASPTPVPTFLYSPFLKQQTSHGLMHGQSHGEVMWALTRTSRTWDLTSFS